MIVTRETGIKALQTGYIEGIQETVELIANLIAFQKFEARNSNAEQAILFVLEEIELELGAYDFKKYGL